MKRLFQNHAVIVLTRLILFFAILHLAIILYTAATLHSILPLNLFSILGLSIFFPDFSVLFATTQGTILSSLVALVLYIVLYLTSQKNS